MTETYTTGVAEIMAKIVRNYPELSDRERVDMLDTWRRLAANNDDAANWFLSDARSIKWRLSLECGNAVAFFDFELQMGKGILR